MRLLLTFALLALAPTLALAQAGDWDFDAMPPGVWGGPILFGDPACVEVVPMENAGGAPLPSGASGNILCIDTRGKNGSLGFRINYGCGGVPTGICKLRYGFSGAAWSFGAGFAVYINDDGSYDNPDDLFMPPVGIPPSTTFGHNSENEQGCNVGHTMDVIVQPNTVAYFDDFSFECLDPIPVDDHSWGAVKSRFGAED